MKPAVPSQPTSHLCPQSSPPAPGLATADTATGNEHDMSPGRAQRPRSHLRVVVGDDGRARPGWAATDPLVRSYYDTEWGVPIRDEAGLYELIALLGFQAGLSWRAVLARREALRQAFDGFLPDVVSGYSAADVGRLINDTRIIRNRRKILAAIQNAQATLALRGQDGLVKAVWSAQPSSVQQPTSIHDAPDRSPESAALAEGLRSHGFVMVGPVSMFALLESAGVVDPRPLERSPRIDKPGVDLQRRVNRRT